MREPYGVVGVITPWNGPLNQAARGIAPALAAGNAVVAKTSEFTSTPRSNWRGSRARMRLASRCVLNVVLVQVTRWRRAVSHPQVRKIAFTGSVRAGARSAGSLRSAIIPLTLELGGKSPTSFSRMQIFGASVAGAVRLHRQCGPGLLAGTRLLVQASVYDKVVGALVKAVGPSKWDLSRTR